LGYCLTGLMVWFGGAWIIEGSLTFGAFMAFWICLRRLIQPLSDLSEKYSLLQSAMAAGERIFGVLDTEPERSGGLQTPIRGEIELEGVSFSYDGEREVLREISLHISPGEKLAVVGLTGAGKTTLMHLLMGFYPVTRGRLRIDGRPLEEYDLRHLRSQFGLVSQDVFLFPGTIEDNIRLPGREASFEQVVEWAKQVHLDRIVSRFPAGYRTDIRERGVALSGGERQLISIARALSFDPRVVILDEATSYVDVETEQRLQEATARLLESRTSIVVAHRLVTVRSSDRILVLHQGRIVEEGSHAELASRDGLYRKLCRLQFHEAGRPGAPAG
jgi:ABC-type multidrug transport system fused ATPase/permease subunit